MIPLRTDGEHRAYSRGYARARSRSWDRFRRVIEIAKRYRAAAKAPFPDLRCETCDRWMRGDGINNSKTCVWGSCRADFEFDLEPRMWIDHDVAGKIITDASFGCASWIPRRV